jgi:hypothetical protein
MSRARFPIQWSCCSRSLVFSAALYSATTSVVTSYIDTLMTDTWVGGLCKPYILSLSKSGVLFVVLDLILFCFVLFYFVFYFVLCMLYVSALRYCTA